MDGCWAGKKDKHDDEYDFQACQQGGQGEMVKVKEGQSDQHQQRAHGVKFPRRVEPGIEIGKTQYAHCTTREKDEATD